MKINSKDMSQASLIYTCRDTKYLIWPVLFLQIDNNYPKITEVNWYGCKRNGFIQDGDTQGTQMIEQESFMDTDVMDIEVIDIRDGKNFYFFGKASNLTEQRNPGGDLNGVPANINPVLLSCPDL